VKRNLYLALILKLSTLKRVHVILSLLAAFLLSETAVAAQNFSLDSLGQRFSVFTQYFAPEKLYLHCDRTYYTTGETIWFNGMLQNASPATVRACSNYIYVELQDADANVVRRVKIKRRENSFPGSIDIPEGLGSGKYTLRAYTLSQTYGDPEYMFHQSVDILGAEGRKDKKAGKTVADRIDVTFYPEGGRWFYGNRADIGFKAMDQDGRSVELNSSIVNQDGEFVTTAVTRHDGMGLLTIFPQPGQTYFLLMPDGSRAQLPQPSSDGATINLVSLTSRWCISVAGFGEYSLVLRDLSSLRHIANVELDGGFKQFVLSASTLNPGINHLMLIDPLGQIVSERLFFVYGDQTALPVCTLTPGGDLHQARSLLSLRLSLSDGAGIPLDGDCSVSVIRGSLASHVQNEGIVSYLRLSSEIKGSINNPDYYFDSEIPLKERAKNLDLLMRIQGWTYYETKSRPYREYEQFVTGRIDRWMGNKVPKKFSLFVWIPQQKFNNYVDVDEGSSFIIDSLDFEENTGFLVKVGRETPGFAYVPKWDGDSFAMKYKYYPAPGLVYAKVPQEDIPLSLDVVTDTLEAAVVTAEDAFTDLIGGHSVSHSELDFYRDRRLIEYIEMKYPTFKYKDDGMFNTSTHAGGFSITTTDEEGNETSVDGGGPAGNVKLVVDGVAQEWWMFEDALVEDITSLSVSKMPDTFYQAPGGVVSIKLRSGARIERRSDTQPSLAYFVPLGYQAPTKFYSPRYDRGDVSEEFDHRNTIYWNPSVRFTGGKAQLRFCNTDQMDLPYIVRIEGMTLDGRPFSRHQEIR